MTHYFDNAATTRPFQEALDAYEKVCLSHFGNPSSRHRTGFDASDILEESRRSILSVLGVAKTHDLIFLSGATEANNLALKGAAFCYQNRGKKILYSPIEHPSVLAPIAQLSEHFGFEAIPLEVDQDGVISLHDLEAKMDKDVILVSVMGVNNETGTIEPIDEIARIVRRFPKAFLHSDLTQAIGKIDMPLQDIDLFSFSAHKFGGMKGNGALVCKKTMRFLPLLSGGEQEKGLRAGTVDVAGAKAMAVALQLAEKNKKANLDRMEHLRDSFVEKLRHIEGIVMNSPSNASPYVIDFSLRNHKASVVVEALSNRGFDVSSVSACSSKGEPSSYVLLAMGKDPRLAANPIRVSFLPSTGEDEIDLFIAALTRILQEVRPL